MFRFDLYPPMENSQRTPLNTLFPLLNCDWTSSSTFLTVFESTEETDSYFHFPCTIGKTINLCNVTKTKQSKAKID